MRLARRLLATAILGFAVFGSSVPDARADAWKDEKLGYSFQVPAKWDSVPVDPGGFLAAQFRSNREYDCSDAKTNTWATHRPYIEVVVIPFAAREDGGAVVEKTEKGLKITKNAPWKDLKEYMDKVFQDRGIGGFHFSGEEAGTVGGMKVRMLEITVDKLVQAEKRIFGWEFAGEDAYYGLVAEILVKEEKKLKPEILGAFSTFRTFARKGALPGTRTGEEIEIRDPKKEAAKEVTPEELKKNRQDATARALSRLKENLPKDWILLESPNFIAVSHADPKYTRELLQHGEALRAWLEKELGFVGNGFAGRVILRICQDNKEYEGIQGVRNWSWEAPEILTYKDRDGWSDWQIRSLNREVFRHWMRDKNERLSWGLPQWISAGLPFFIEGARLKGGRIEFQNQTWESVEMKNLRRSDSLFKPRDFFSIPSEELWKLDGAAIQTQFFVQFLMGGGAARSPRFRNVFPDYLKNIIFLLDSEPDDAGGEGAKAPENEEEEARQARERQNAYRKRESDTLGKLMEKTFAGWTDKDWDAFQAAYRQFLK